MSAPADYEFDWDDDKAAINLGKHGVDFLEAMTVLADPLAMTFYDTGHSDDEDRWVSVGRARSTARCCWRSIRLSPRGPTARWCESFQPDRLPSESVSSMSKGLQDDSQL